MQRSTHLVRGSTSNGRRRGLGEQRFVYLLSVPYSVQSQSRDRLIGLLKGMERVEVLQRTSGSARPPAIKISSTQSKDAGLLQTLAQRARGEVRSPGQGWSLSLVDTTGQNGNGSGGGNGNGGGGNGGNGQIVAGVSNTTLLVGAGAAATGIIALVASS